MEINIPRSCEQVRHETRNCFVQIAWYTPQNLSETHIFFGLPPIGKVVPLTS
jgi:hypothetical protein